MRSRRARRGLTKFGPEIRAKQSNIVWPDFLVNSRGVDAFLWKGSPNPTTVQRIAAWLFGGTYIASSACLAVLAWRAGGIGMIALGIIAIGGFALGIKTFSNGFAKRRKGKGLAT
jgi:hypothetical protein